MTKLETKKIQPFMRWNEGVIHHNSVTTAKVGMQIISASGVGFEITEIRIMNLDLLNGRSVRPEINITFKYDDNGQRGSCAKSLEDFYESIHS